MDIDYTLPENMKEARLMVREWGMEDDFGVAKAKSLLEAYRATEDQKQKRHLGLLLAMIYETLIKGVAYECATGFGLEKERGLSVSESIFCDDYGRWDKFIWRKDMSGIDDKFDFSTNESDWRKLANIVPENMANRPMVLFREENGTNIYVVRNIDGIMRIMGVNQCNKAFLPDENFFNGEPPLYFTDCSHFVSPVFYVQTIHTIIEYILKEIGYPPLPIEKSVIFPSEKAANVDEEKYEPDGELEDLWIGVAVNIGIRENRNMCLYNENLRKMMGSNMLSVTGNRLSMVLCKALCSASYMFRYMAEHKLLGKANMNDLPIMAEKLRIFEREEG